MGEYMRVKRACQVGRSGGGESIREGQRFSLSFLFFGTKEYASISLKITPSSGLLYAIYGQLSKPDKEEKNNGRRAGPATKLSDDREIFTKGGL
jgi:hypothetical protein